jgi:catechol 2,3-dioxygenase-like lactoylglutathione lyase family enzyme
MWFGPHLTHIALRVKDIDRTASFYSEWVNLEIVHDRVSESSGTRVAWIAERGRKPTFVLVLLEFPFEQSAQPAVDHLGFATANREEIDRIAAKAKDRGLLVEGPTDAGPVVGYYCIILDPNGHRVEFSWGQTIEWQ